MRLLPTYCWLSLAACLLTGLKSGSEIVVEGIADRAVVTGIVRPRVIPAEGFLDVLRIDGRIVGTGETLEISDPDYHELEIVRSTTAGVATESRTVQFIVRSADRGNSEWGLPPWTPPAPIPASAEEIAHGRLRFLYPPAIPAGSPLPMAVWLEGPDGHVLRAHARLESPAHPAFLLRRGSGSSHIPAASLPVTNGVFHWVSDVPGLEAFSSVRIEERPDWIRVTGRLAGSADWGEDARVVVDGDLEIPEGATLVVGAGSLIRMTAGATWKVFGRVEVRGTAGRAVLFTAAEPGQPWGGVEIRGGAASLEGTHTLWTESGSNPAWFNENPGFAVHRREQALFLIDGGDVRLTDCAAFDGHGQFGHGREGRLTLERCLVQRFITGGEFNGGRVEVRNSALIEFPRDDGIFTDDDNDAIYLTHGDHWISDTVIGWARDDGIDAGSGGAGSVTASNVWVEAVFHDAFAWSGAGRRATNLHCVAIHCGQGIECGWSSGSDSPRVIADDCLCLENVSGARFGDNYDTAYTGFLQVTESLLLGNYRDVFGMNWDDWTWRTARMDIRGNRLGRVPDQHQNNTAWNPAVDGWRLAAFMNTSPGARVGIGLTGRRSGSPRSGIALGLEVGLSRFATNEVGANWRLDSPRGTWDEGTVGIPPGRMTTRIQGFRPLPDDGLPYRLSLIAASNAVVTGASQHIFLPPETPDSVVVRLDWHRFNDETVLIWNDRRDALDEAPAPSGPWRASSLQESPATVGGMATRFFRLRGNVRHESPLTDPPGSSRRRTRPQPIRTLP